MLKASRISFYYWLLSLLLSPFKVLHVICLLMCSYSWVFFLAPELLTYCTDVITCIRASWYVCNVLCDMHKWFRCVYSPFIIIFIMHSNGMFYWMPVLSQVCFYLQKLASEAASSASESSDLPQPVIMLRWCGFWFIAHHRWVTPRSYIKEETKCNHLPANLYVALEMEAESTFANSAGTFCWASRVEEVIYFLFFAPFRL